nr:hypothetical protein [uncultured Macellibacteroides sp.]
MKILNFCLMGITLLILNSCENDNLELSKDQLSQTQWSGSLSFKEANVPYNCDINISFETPSRGRYVTSDLDTKSEYSQQTTIEYTIDKKVVSIFGGVHNILLGDWYIYQLSKKQLTLKRDMDISTESTLILNKTNRD